MEYVNEKKAAEHLSVSVSLLRKWRQRRLGPPVVKLAGRCLRYRLQDLDAYAATKRVMSEGADAP